MRNLLSLKPGTPILGSEIREWCDYNISKNTSHAKMAKRISDKFSNIQDDLYYEINLAPSTSGCGQKAKHKPILIRSNKMNRPELRHQ